MSKLKLLPPELLVKTSDVDHAEWNYRPILGLLQRTRFKLIARLLGDLKVRRLLDIGYGSGVFYPQLKTHADELVGIDIHDMAEEVEASLMKADIAADLSVGSVSDMTYDDDSIDCAVSVSAMEYVEDIDRACQQIVRVLSSSGCLILVTPGQSPILDFGLKLLGGEDAEENYGDRRERLHDALMTHFTVDRMIPWPRPTLPGLTVYRAYRLSPRKA